MKRVMSSGLLRLECPKCGDVIEVKLTVVDAFGDACREAQLRHRPARKHPVEFLAEAPHLHADFWGHLVRCHQPNPHPYMSPGVVGNQP